MGVVEHELPGEGFGAKLVAEEVDGWVVVTMGGFVLGRWSSDDLLTRDHFIAASHLNGLKGVTIARLAFVHASYVTRTIQRYQRGGVAALASREKAGRKLTFDLAARKRALALRARGFSFRQIAERLGFSAATIATELKGVAAGPAPQTPPLLPEAVEAAGEVPRADAPPHAQDASAAVEESAPGTAAEVPPVAPAGELAEAAQGGDDAEELRPGARLPPDGAPHPCRYAGTLLAVGALRALGLESAVGRAAVRRSKVASYSASQALTALSAAWAAGYRSIEALHERDARALGVVLGLERSPSVRTLWRAVDQMTEHYDPVQWWAGWMVALASRCPPELPVWGVDGHFKAYAGDEPIDKGWNTKRRLAERGVATVRVTDLRGATWSDLPVRAGDHLHQHVVASADALCAAQEAAGRPARPVVLAFDRGGFDFDVLNALAAAGHWYLAWVPGTVSLPDLGPIGPAVDGVGEAIWTHASVAGDLVARGSFAYDAKRVVRVETHPRLTHLSRLLVERDGASRIPAATNLPPWVDTSEALGLLRAARGMEENGIKAARQFVAIDHLDDRGAQGHRPDDRPVSNPARAERKRLLQKLETAERDLHRERPVPGERPQREINLDLRVNAVHQRVVREQIASLPERVERRSVVPGAERAELDERNRQLLLPLKNATDNARRWLLWQLGAGLSPSDHAYDQDTRARTLDAVLKSPGTVRFGVGSVEVTIDLHLPPTAHRRLSEALASLDRHSLRDGDGRHLRFRLARRATRADLPRAAG